MDHRASARADAKPARAHSAPPTSRSAPITARFATPAPPAFPLHKDQRWQRSGARDSHSPKEPDLKSELEQRAKTGEAMDGFQLAYADLSGIDLVRKHEHGGYRLRGADLYRADLEGAHLFKLDMRGCSLMKANLRGANLHCADLRDCNLLGTNFKQAKLENVVWGDELIQEQRARATAEPGARHDLYQQAEEIYRNLRLCAEEQGLFELSGHFFRKEMVMRRHQLPDRSIRKMGSYAADLVCGYGEDPLRVITFSAIVIASFGLLYFFTGLEYLGEPRAFSLHASLSDNLSALWDSFYFSALTSTTRGYGDVSPTGITRAFAILQAFIGSFTVALFVVVFVKKLTR